MSCSPVVSDFSEQFSKLYSGTSKLSIGGSVILFKGGSHIKPHNTQTGLRTAAREEGMYLNTLRTGSFKLFKRPLPGFLTILTL